MNIGLLREDIERIEEISNFNPEMLKADFDTEFDRLFKLVDVDGNGRITKEAFEKFYPNKIDDWTEVLDINENGSISIHELRLLYTNKNNYSMNIGLLREDIERIEEISNFNPEMLKADFDTEFDRLFKLVDVDGNGRITKEAFEKFYPNIIDDWTEVLDINENGSISIHELRLLYTNKNNYSMNIGLLREDIERIEEISNFNPEMLKADFDTEFDRLFKLVDVDGNGRITKEAFEKFYPNKIDD
jgi:Ca2+-binding EF-hand superfamily protein